MNYLFIYFKWMKKAGRGRAWLGEGVGGEAGEEAAGEGVVEGEGVGEGGG